MFYSKGRNIVKMHKNMILIYGELDIVLELEKEQVKEYIIKHVESLEDK